MCEKANEFTRKQVLLLLVKVRVKRSRTFLTVITQIRTFSLNLSTSIKNRYSTRYSPEISFQKEWEYHNFFLKFFRKTLRCNLNMTHFFLKKHKFIRFDGFFI